MDVKQSLLIVTALLSSSTWALEAVQESVQDKHTTNIYTHLHLDEDEVPCQARVETATWPKTVLLDKPMVQAYTEGVPSDHTLRVLYGTVEPDYAGVAKQIHISCQGANGTLSRSFMLPAPTKFTIDSRVQEQGGRVSFSVQSYIDHQQAGGQCELLAAPQGFDLWGNGSSVSEKFWADYYSAEVSFTSAEAPLVLMTVVDCTSKAGTHRHERVWLKGEGGYQVVEDKHSYR